MEGWGRAAEGGVRIVEGLGPHGVLGRIVRVGEKVEEQIVAKDVGFLIQNAVA